MRGAQASTRRGVGRVAVLLGMAVLMGACSASPQSGSTETQAPTTSTGAPANPTAGPTVPAAATTTPSPSTTPAVAPTDAPIPAPTAAPWTGLPPKPGNATWTLLEQTPIPTGIRERYRLAWTEPAGAATTFIAYGVTDCLRYAKRYDGAPCVVKGMAIPKARLVEIGRTPGADRQMVIAYERGGAGPGPYAAILVRAVNGAGRSIFTIAWSEDVCYGCTY